MSLWFLLPFLFFLYLRGKERKETAKEKKENTQMFPTSSQEYSLQLSRILQAGKPALFASLVASLDARHCFCRAKLAEHCLRAVPEFARLKRFGVAEQRNTAERVYTREDVGILLGFFFLFRPFSFFLLLSKKKEKGHCKI